MQCSNRNYAFLPCCSSPISSILKPHVMYCTFQLMGKTFLTGNQSATITTKIPPSFLDKYWIFLHVTLKSLKWTKCILGPELVVFNVYLIEFWAYCPKPNKLSMVHLFLTLLELSLCSQRHKGSSVSHHTHHIMWDKERLTSSSKTRWAVMNHPTKIK